jgi:hypothetical protein
VRIARRYVEAFKENLNVIGLTTAAAVSAATVNPLPLLVSLVAEAAYLLFVPDSKWYDARLSKRYDVQLETQRKRVREQVVPTLRQAMQKRFTRLEEMRGQMDAQAIERETWFCEVLDKLDYLLEKFLVFASKESQFRDYLHSVQQEVGSGKKRKNKGDTRFESKPTEDRRQRHAPVSAPGKLARSDSQLPSDETDEDADVRWVSVTVVEIQSYYDREIAGLEKERDQEKDADTQAILQKRLEVIKRRREFVGKIEKILANLNHQLRLVEDTFGLINDEIRARSPEQLLADIEQVVGQTDNMAKVLEEVAPYEQLVARMQQTMT